MAVNEKAHKARLDYMREQVLEIELQARYWKANYEVKHYSLEDERIKPEYAEYLERAEKRVIEEIETLNQQEAEKADKELNIESLSTKS